MSFSKRLWDWYVAKPLVAATHRKGVHVHSICLHHRPPLTAPSRKVRNPVRGNEAVLTLAPALSEF